jgi:transposase
MVVNFLSLPIDPISNNNVEVNAEILLQLLESQTETIKELQRSNAELQKSNQALNQEIHLLNEKLSYFTDRFFGRSKETLDSQVSGQLNLFSDDCEENTACSTTEAIQETAVKGHKRKIGQKAAKIAHLPLKEAHHELPIDQRICEQCGTQMIDIGTTKIREEVLFHQAMLDRLVHLQHTYCCKECEKAAVSSYKKAPVPKPVVANSLGSNSVIAETIRLKFGQKVPANRQESYWQETLGLDISRDNITNWHIKVCHNALDPLAQRLRVYLNQEEVLHADETTYRVIEKGKKDTHYWLFSTGKHSLHPIVYYQHAETRAGEVPKQFLADFKGYLHCDGYSGYHAVEEVTLVYCLVHARRKFFEAIPKNNQNEEIPAWIAVKMMDIWFKLEQEWAPLSVDVRLKKRHDYLKPLFVNFYEWLGSFTAVPKSKLDTAVNYALKLRGGFEKIFEDGRLELSNNLAERQIKELVIGRKNYMHSRSLEGARTSGIILSVYRTAEANGLDPAKYLEFLFDRIPNLESLSDETLDELLPWLSLAQKNCAKKYIKNTK